MNELIHRNKHSDVFSPSSSPSSLIFNSIHEMNSKGTEGIDVYVTRERIIYLDVQPILHLFIHPSDPATKFNQIHANTYYDVIIYYSYIVYFLCNLYLFIYLFIYLFPFLQ